MSKVRQIALILPIMLRLISTLLGVILVDVLWSVLSYGGEPPGFLCRRKPEKEKNNHGHDDNFCRVLSNFCRLKATIFLVFIYI